jgi:hypothetical protein
VFNEEKKNCKNTYKSSKTFDDFIQECRVYGLSVTRERLITSLDQFSEPSYKFAMSANAKVMVVIFEAGDNDDDI